MFFVWSLILVFTVFAVLVLYFALAPRIGSNPSGDRLQRIQALPNYDKGKLHNAVATNMDMPMSTMAGVLWEFMKGAEGREPKQTLPTVPFDRAAWDTVPSTSFATCWFGHSSLLIKIGGITFLVDPVFGKRASTFSFAGPERFNYEQHMTVAMLPMVDVVLLSHDHYDHLDHETIVQLKDKPFIAPMGVGAHLEQWGIPAAAITEKVWWEGTEHKGVHLTLVPSRHFSGRGMTNRFSTLWGAWAMEANGKKIYFGADSGYSPTFKEVGERFGPFDLALLECGAYDRRWPDIHMMPEETAQAAVDVQARVLMPIHWAKFSLGMHSWKEPIERLTKRAEVLGVPLLTPRIGRTVVDADRSTSERWWAGLE